MSTHRRNRGRWSAESRDELEEVQQVLSELNRYWPLTLRQVYYHLVAAGVIENDLWEYKKLSRLLSKARIEGLVPWGAIEDRARTTLPSARWDDVEQFIDEEIGNLLDGYRRDLLQSQDVAPEIWVEKDALVRICHRAAYLYCVPVIAAKGFSSVSHAHEAAQRIRRNNAEGKKTRILYFGDLDPSGWEMLPSMLMRLEDEMGLKGLIEGVRCALTPELVEEHGLPENPDALKLTDSRARKYMKRFGDLAVELDALPPSVLEDLVRESIECHVDLARLEEEWAIQESELHEIDSLRNRIVETIEEDEA